MALKVQPPQIDGYEYRSLLGSGGYSEVFLYYDLGLEREVAIKVLTEGASEAEAKTMAALSRHPFVVDIYRTGVTSNGLPFLIMQYWDGGTYAARVAERMLLPDVLQLGVQMSGALAFAHSMGVLHRDIKPANILMTSEFDNPGLTDFGIASRADSPSDQGGLSLPWVPPEVLRTGESDARGDVYALAATLFTLLEGHAPYVVPNGDNSEMALISRTLAGPAPLPRNVGRSDTFGPLMRSALSTLPDARPASAEEFGRALNAVEGELKLAQTPLVVQKRIAPTRPVPAPGDETTVRPRIIPGDSVVDVSQARPLKVAPLPAPAGLDDVTRARNGVIDSVPARPAPSTSGPRIRLAVRPMPTASKEPIVEDFGNGVPGSPAQAGDQSRSIPIRTVAVAFVLLLGVVVAALAISLSSDDPLEVAGIRKSESEEVSKSDPTVPLAVPGAASLALSRTSDDKVEVSWMQATGLSFRWQRCDPGADQAPQERPADAVSEPFPEDPAATRWSMSLQAPIGTYPCVRLFVVDGSGNESDGTETQLVPEVGTGGSG